MDAKLKWSTNKLGSDKFVRIYKSETYLQPSQKGQLLVELAKGVDTYTDVGIAANKISFYRIAFVDGNGVESLGPVQAVPNFPNGTGPGSAKLLRGDWVTGYFGKVPVAELFTGTALKAALGTTALGGSAGLSDAQITYYHKWVIEGEIIFVLPGWLLVNVSWVGVYNLGLIYGTNDNGPAATMGITGLAAKNQLKEITAGANTFRVRAPKGFFAPLDQLLDLTVAKTPGVYNKTEWEKISYALSVEESDYTLPLENNVPRFYHYTTGNTEFSKMGSITQHLNTAAGASCYRGQPGNKLDSVLSLPSKSILYGWVPILVLKL